MDVRSAAERWAGTWQRCWQLREVEPIVALYADDAVFSQAFRQPRHGRDGVRAYVRSAFADEEAIEAWFGAPICDGEQAVVEWSAALREEGREITLSGCSLLRFGEEGRCVSQHDYWNEAPGRRPPRWRSSPTDTGTSPDGAP